MIRDAVIISIKVVVVAIAISLLIALILNYFNSKKKKVLSFVILIPMFLPPSAIGYGILLLMGSRGIIGRSIYKYFDMSIVFTIVGAILVGVVVSIPIMYQAIQVALLEVKDEVKLAARDMGASKFQVYTKICLPLSKRGILTGIILSIGRVFGEFGATILVAGNIPGKTQTVPMALYYAIENSDGAVANKIMIIIVIISIVLTGFYNFILMKSNRERKE